jgi:tripartite-type tricarboxylate transporter receptor subunit TctC
MLSRLLMASAIFASLWVSQCWAQGTPPREVRVLVGSSTGGGYDTFGRIVAPFLGKHLPGNPTIVVQNMPGGDGLTATNYIAQLGPKDGSMIAITNRNFTVAPLLGMVEQSSVHYDASKLTWLANLNSDVSFVIVRSETGIKTMDDLRKHEVVVGSTGLTANNGIYPYVANNLLGTHFKVVTGYPGSAEVAMALDRGEIDGVVGFSSASLTTERPDWLRDNKINLVMQLGLTPLAGYEKVPLMIDLAKNDNDRRALELIAAPNIFGRPFFAPPNLPPEITKYLRQAFADLAGDPQFKAAAEKAKLDITYMPGEKVQEQVQELNAASPEVVKIARAALQRGSTEVDKRK